MTAFTDRLGGGVMVRLGYSAQAVRDAEAPHLAAGEPLMQRAAHALAGAVQRELAGREAGAPEHPSWRVVLLVGSGNNGGDALFAGAELAGLRVGGARIDVVAVGVGSRMHDAGREAAAAAGVRLLSLPPDGPAEVVAVGAAVDLAVNADVIVDGMLGTGTSADAPALRGSARELVSGILDAVETMPSGSRRPIVVAVDLPSGVHPDSGAVADGVVLPASVTVTFGGIKAGLLRGAGARVAGRVELAMIGIEDDLAAVPPLVVAP
ncbi:NAD(P)H-hydrate epimerase [Herbiconiux sp. P18]|uniref:NAD(P)H-hydrate epimerase n=1 Tax=Herbiconiux liangxiaofengii TaxID=3342795 RepID=UPI0035B712D2